MINEMHKINIKNVLIWVNNSDFYYNVKSCVGIKFGYILKINK